MLRKILAAVLVLAMVLSVAIVPMSVSADTLDNGLFVHYTFDENANDVSGNDNNGTLMGDASITSVDSRSVVSLTGNDGSIVRLPGDLGSGLGDFTVSIVYKQSVITKNAFLWNLCGGRCTSAGNDGTGSFFFHPSNDSATRAVSTKDNWSSERNAYYKNANGSNAIAPANQWHQAIIVVKGYQLSLYMDGRLMDTITVDIKASDIPQSASNTYNTLGGSPYDEDPNCTAYVDDFRMYNRALSNEEIAALDDLVGDGYAAQDEAAVDAAIASLTVAEAVSENISLPSTVGNSVFVFWETSDASVITADGVITRGSADQTATLTATVTRGTISKKVEFPVTVIKANLSDEDKVKLDKAWLNVDGINEVENDLVLPETAPEGSSITWTSSNPEAISVYGIVTRPEELSKDIVVTLTATIKNGEAVDTKEFVATIKADPVYSDEMYGYMMAHFPNVSPYPTSFSLSLDGTTFTKVNPNSTQLVSKVGNGMTRDPFLIRGEDNTFHIIATDGWASPYIFSSDSPDLVDWSAQRTMYVNKDLIDRGVMYTGGSYAYHAWAPECTYDATVGKYLIYWSAETNESLANGLGQIGTGYYQKTYACYTEDFINFETPFILVDPGFTMIDPTMYNYEGKWYFVSKNEENQSNSHPTGKKLIWGEADALAGPWTVHEELVITEDSRNKEGPTVYKEIGGDGWFLAWDYYSNSAMGVAYTTTPDDMSTWKIQSSSIAGDVRHPSVIQVTEKEYYRVLEAFKNATSDSPEYPEAPEVTPQVSPILHYTFEADTIDGTTVKDVSGNGNDGTLVSSPTFEADPLSEDGQSLRLTNNNVSSSSSNGQHVSMPSQIVADLSDVTITSWVYAINQSSASRTQQGRLFDFGTGPSSGPTDYFFFTTQDGGSNTSGTRFSITTNGSGAESNASGPNRSANTWYHVALIIKGDSMYYYYNGQLVGQSSAINAKPYMLNYTAAFLGRSMWSSDKYFNGRIDDFRIYNRAISEDEIAAIYAGNDNEAAAKFAMDVESIDLGDLSAVTEDIVLPAELQYGSTVVWSSDKEQFIAADGSVTRPSLETGKAPVTLTAVVTSADGSQSRELTFKAIVLPEEKIEYTLTSDKDQYEIDEIITLTATTPVEATKIGIFNESGKGITRLSTSSEIVDGVKVWTTTIKVASKGNRTISIKALADGQAFADVDYLASVNVTIVKPVVIADPSIVEGSVVAPETAKVREAFTFTVVTNKDASKIGVFNESGVGVSTVKSYVDEGENRVWTVSMTVNSLGSRTFKVMCAGSDKVWVDEGYSFNISIKKK